MNTQSKLVVNVLVVVSIALILSWLAGSVFLGLLGLDHTEANPFTIYRYGFEQWDEKRVQDALFITLIIGLLVVFALAALVRNIKKEKLHGDAKWATLYQVRKAGLIDGDGIILGRMQGKYLTLSRELFAMVAAPTRSGKGVSLVVPNLLNWSQSAVVLDIKFENYEITSGFRKKHGQEVYLFNPSPRDYATHRYNALGYISLDPNHRIDDIQKIANFLIPTPKGGDPMWSSEARDLFFGVVLLLLDHGELPVTLGEVLRQLKTEQPSAEYFAHMISGNRERLSSQCVASLNNYINKPAKTAEGVKSTITGALNLWANPLIDSATSDNDFDLRELRKKHMTVYLGFTPDNLDRLAPLINLFVQQLIDLNTRDLPAKYDQSGKIISGNADYKYQVLLVLDEFTALGRVKILEKAIGFIAGYGLRLMTIIQSPSQLRSEYGHDVAETFMKNHAAKIVFRPETMKEAEEIAGELGFKTVTQNSITTPRGLGSGSGTKTKSVAKRQLLLPQEVKALADNAAIVLASGCPPIKGEKMTYYKDRVFQERVMEKVSIPKLTIETVELRGAHEELDLSFIYGTVEVPKHDDRELSDAEIDDIANCFFDSLVAQQDVAA